MISIIIVGFNSKKYLKDCFSSIFRSSYKRYRIIFVDNNSSDGSVEFIKNNYPKIIVIASKKNNGFAKGNNIGIRRALKLKTDYLFILNPDTLIDRDCLKTLLKNADQKNILQPLILLYENGKKTKLINTSGNYLHFLGFSYCSDYRKDMSIFDGVKSKDIAGASGAGMLIPIAIIKKVKGFDPIFFMYYEDMDLSWRARLAGFKVMLVPEAKVWHTYSFSKGKSKLYYVERNRLLFMFKNFSFRYLLLIFPMFIVNEMLVIIFSIFGYWFLTKIKSYFGLLIVLLSSLRARTSLTRRSYREERILKRYLKPTIVSAELHNSLFPIYNIILKSYWGVIKIFI